MTIKIDKYKRKDGTPVRSHKRSEPEYPDLKFSKEDLKNTDFDASLKKKEAAGDQSFTSMIEKARCKQNSSNNDTPTRKFQSNDKVRVKHSPEDKGRILGIARKTNSGYIEYSVELHDPLRIQEIPEKDLETIPAKSTLRKSVIIGATRDETGNTSNKPTYYKPITYQGHKIFYENGLYKVITPEPDEIEYIVALDDSKATGSRSINQEMNTLSGSKIFIDRLRSGTMNKPTTGQLLSTLEKNSKDINGEPIITPQEKEEIKKEIFSGEHETYLDVTAAITRRYHEKTGLYNKRYRNAGSKYDRDRDIKDIAKEVRKRLKSLSGVKKVSARIERYAGGRAINVEFKELSYNPINPQWIEDYAKDPNNTRGGEAYLYTQRAQNLLDNARNILKEYNYDNSDSMTDYFDVNFYSTVKFDHDLEQESKKEIRKRKGLL